MAYSDRRCVRSYEIAQLSIGGNLKPRVKVLHVEVGGTLGGSYIALERYIRHSDNSRYEHEVAFWSQPARVQNSSINWRTIDLGFQVLLPSQRKGAAKQSGMLERVRRIPWLHAIFSNMRTMAGIVLHFPRMLHMAKFFKSGSYKLIHINNNFNYQLDTLIAARLAGKPVVAHFRTPVPLNCLEKQLSRLAKCITPINALVDEYLRANGIKYQTTVCHDIVEPAQLPTAQDTKEFRAKLVEGCDWVVGTVSRLEPNKGIRDFLLAASLLHSRWPRLRFVIVGEGGEEAVLKQFTSSLELDGAINFVGYCDDAFLYYSSFDVFVCPSYTEGGPFTVMEAMQAGCAVVSTRVGQVPELIQNGVNGLVVEPGQPHALATAIEFMLENPTRRREMAVAGKSSIQRVLQPAQRASEFDNVLAKVL